MPPRQRSIHIGVNTVAPAAYPRPPAALTAAEADAEAMVVLAGRAGSAATLLVGRAATRDAVSDALRIAAATSRAGDRLVLTFSGHGARFDDTPAAPVVARPVGARNTSVGDEADGFDESWCLHDGVLLDDDLYRLLARFEPGVWIYLLSDSCYSGTIVRIDDPLRGDRLRGEPEIRATVLLSAGAAEREMCFTTAVRGQFTAAVLAAWDEGRFTGSHLDFHAAVRERSAPGQVPELGRYGIPSDAFERARPFGAR